MSASQDQGVDPDIDQLSEIASGNLIGDRILPEAFLHQRDEERTCLSGDLYFRIDRLYVPGINAAGDGSLRADHADPSVGGRSRRRPGSRPDHSDHGDVRLLFQFVQRIGAGRIAGHHDRFHPLRIQKTDNLTGVAQDRLLRFTPVRQPGGISKINDSLPRRLTHDLSRHRQPPYSGVKDAHRRVSVSHLSLSFPLPVFFHFTYIFHKTALYTDFPQLPARIFRFW